MSGADRVSILPEGKPNRPGLKLVGGKPEYITIHETANTNSGANAEMHRKFVHAGGGTAGVSFHYVVDDRESIQLMPDDEVAWHAGDGRNGRGNNRSIAIEICVNSDGNFLLAVQKLVILVVHLMREYEIPLANVVQHNHWSGKNCPRRLRLTGWEELRRSAGSQPRTFEETGKTLSGDFLEKWDSEPHAMEYWGCPTRDEEEVDLPPVGTVQVQYLERARFERHPDGAIRLGRLGTERVNV